MRVLPSLHTSWGTRETIPGSKRVYMRSTWRSERRGAAGGFKQAPGHAGRLPQRPRHSSGAHALSTALGRKAMYALGLPSVAPVTAGRAATVCEKGSDGGAAGMHPPRSCPRSPGTSNLMLCARCTSLGSYSAHVLTSWRDVGLHRCVRGRRASSRQGGAK